MRPGLRGLIASAAFLGAACATAVAPAAPPSPGTPSIPEPTAAQAAPTVAPPVSRNIPRSANPKPQVVIETATAKTGTPTPIPPTPTPAPDKGATPTAVPTSRPAETAAPEESQLADPISAALRELNPAGPKPIERYAYQQLLSQDAIRPVYNPTYLPAQSVPLEAQDLVIGVSIAGENRAYPIRTLHFIEMVNDELGGVPILVTW